MSVAESIPRRDDSRDGGGRRRQAALGAAGGLALVVVLWGGYSHHWPWTGINGGTATLWDWLHLLMLPLAFAVLPTWFSRETRVHPRTKAYACLALTVFVVVVVVGGYLGSWTWTGFTGNTLWKWINLLFLPLLVPTVILPALKPIATGRVIYLDKDGKPIEDGAPQAAQPAPQDDERSDDEGASVRPAPAV